MNLRYGCVGGEGREGRKEDKKQLEKNKIVNSQIWKNVDNKINHGTVGITLDCKSRFDLCVYLGAESGVLRRVKLV